MPRRVRAWWRRKCVLTRRTHAPANQSPPAQQDPPPPPYSPPNQTPGVTGGEANTSISGNPKVISTITDACSNIAAGARIFKTLRETNAAHFELVSGFTKALSHAVRTGRNAQDITNRATAGIARAVLKYKFIHVKSLVRLADDALGIIDAQVAAAVRKHHHECLGSWKAVISPVRVTVSTIVDSYSPLAVSYGLATAFEALL